MASTQVEEEPPVQEVTEETTHAPACCVGEEKPAAPTEESKVDIHEKEIGEDQEKEEKGDQELFKDEEEKVAGSPTISEDRPAPVYGRKLEAEDDDDEDEEDEEESI